MSENPLNKNYVKISNKWIPCDHIFHISIKFLCICFNTFNKYEKYRVCDCVIFANKYSKILM